MIFCLASSITQIGIWTKNLHLNYFAEARKFGVKVNGAPDTWISEFGES